MQIILRRHPCVGDVIFGFDVDSCQFAYDGDRVLATPSALRAYRSVRTCMRAPLMGKYVSTHADLITLAGASTAGHQHG